MKAMKFVQLRSLRDLVMLIASSPTMNVAQHFQSGDMNLYFVIGGTLKETFLYFVKEPKSVQGSFIIYNTYSGEITFSDRLRTEPNVSSIPIVEIQNQNILPEELLTRVEGL